MKNDRVREHCLCESGGGGTRYFSFSTSTSLSLLHRSFFYPPIAPSSTPRGRSRCARCWRKKPLIKTWHPGESARIPPAQQLISPRSTCLVWKALWAFAQRPTIAPYSHSCIVLCFSLIHCAANTITIQVHIYKVSSVIFDLPPCIHILGLQYHPSRPVRSPIDSQLFCATASCPRGSALQTGLIGRWERLFNGFN